MKNKFIWICKNIHNEVQYGVHQAHVSKGTHDYLIAKNLFPQSILKVDYNFIHHRLQLSLLLTLLDSLNQLLSAGLNLTQTFSYLIANTKNKELLKIYVLLQLSLEDGLSFNEAILELKNKFPQIVIVIFGLAENIDNFNKCVTLLYHHFKNQEAKKKKIIASLRYPFIVLLMVIFLFLVIVFFVFPSFQNFYEIVGGELPTSTRFFILVANFITNNFFFILFFMLGCLFSIFIPYIQKINPLHYLLKYSIQSIYKRYDPIIFCHSLYLLLESGAKIEHAIIQATQSMTKLNQPKGKNILDLLHAGESLYFALSQLHWFPKIISVFLLQSEETGQIQNGFFNAYTFLQNSWDERIDFMTSLINPILISVAGIIVMYTIYALYLPIFSAGDFFSQF